MARIKTTDSKYPETLRCFCCGDELKITNFYKTKSFAFQGTGVFPFCKTCFDVIYQKYFHDYTVDGVLHPDRKAVEHICMMLNIYYSDEVFDAAIRRKGRVNDNTPIIALYIKQVSMHQYAKKTYETTMKERTTSREELLGSSYLSNAFLKRC